MGTYRLSSRKLGAKRKILVDLFCLVLPFSLSQQKSQIMFLMNSILLLNLSRSAYFNSFFSLIFIAFLFLFPIFTHFIDFFSHLCCKIFRSSKECSFLSFHHCLVFFQFLSFLSFYTPSLPVLS